jgi:uncharacterized protein YutE (UPF0331/DUF86 family)
MLDTYRIRTRLGEIRKRILILEKEFKPLPEEKLVTEESLYAAAERHLEVAIQACLDIANHLVAALGLERPKEEAGEAFLALAKEKIIDDALAKTMKAVVGYRNILIHEYLEIERHQTYLNIQKGLTDLVSFGKEIEKFLEKR